MTTVVANNRTVVIENTVPMAVVRMDDLREAIKYMGLSEGITEGSILEGFIADYLHDVIVEEL